MIRRSWNASRSVPVRGVARRSTWSSTAAERTAPSSCSPPPAAAKPCSGSPHAPASKPDRTSPPRPPGQAASSSWKSTSTPANATATGSPTSRPAPSHEPCPAATYAVTIDAAVVAAVERKSLPDLVSSLTNGTLRYALGELSALPRAAVVVEDHYSQVFKLDRIRPAVVADGLAELQVRWPDVPIVFCETRQLAEEWTLPLPRRRPRLGQHRDGRHHPHRRARSGTRPDSI